jgi:hypothetical protein
MKRLTILFLLLSMIDVADAQIPGLSQLLSIEGSIGGSFLNGGKGIL